MKQKVISREYKVMLKKERFIGSHADQLKHAENFWNAFKDLIQDIVFDTDGSLDKVDHRRTIRFFDSADFHLRENIYVFRERVDSEAGKREVTLKFRHPDRYVSQDRNMDGNDVENGKTKFEEDIKQPFIGLYSFSTTQPISIDKFLNKLEDLGELYPDLKKRLKPFQSDEPVKVVGDFTAWEVVIVGADFQIGKNPKVEAECALIVWYDEVDVTDKPVVVEFSFRYKNDQESFDGESAHTAYNVFGRLKDMEWVDAEGPTKTAYVFSRA
jgi:hypothetical protein